MRYEPCTNIADTQQILEQRLTNVDFETNPSTEILPHRAAYFRSFPLLDNVVLNKEPAQRLVIIIRTIYFIIEYNIIYSIFKFINLCYPYFMLPV